MCCSVSPTLELIGRRQLGWSGETRNITCIGKALPVPSMNWYRGEQYLHDSDTYRITNVRSADSVASTLSVRTALVALINVLTTSVRPSVPVLALDLEGVHDVKLHHPSSSVATSNQ